MIGHPRTSVSVRVRACSDRLVDTPARPDRWGEQVGEGGEAFGHEAVVGPVLASGPGDEPGVEKHFEVVADRRLGQAERGHKVAHAGLAVSGGLDHADQLQAGGVRDRS